MIPRRYRHRLEVVPMSDQLPDLLTVEEAARLARVGRTKAYAMARQWRATGGRSGLPVVDFGHVLRVPRRALEELIGAELTDFPNPDESAAAATREQAATPAPPVPQPAAERTVAAPPPSSRRSTRRTRRQHDQPQNQLDLFQTRPPKS
jgi:hypothetical protein